MHGETVKFGEKKSIYLASSVGSEYPRFVLRRHIPVVLFNYTYIYYSKHLTRHIKEEKLATCFGLLSA